MKKLTLLAFGFCIAFSAFAKKVRFTVDMTGQTINTTGIHIVGDFQTLAGFSGGDWNAATTQLAGDTISMIYTIVVDIPAFAKYEYKFINGDQFYEAEVVPVESRVGYAFNDNRWIYVDSLSNDTLDIGALRFGGNSPAGLKLMRFVVDLDDEPSIATEGVHIYGDFQGWDPAATRMYSFINSTYEIIAYADSLITYNFKYINGNIVMNEETVPGPCATSGNRTLYLAKDTVIATVCFSSCTTCLTSGIEDNSNSSINIYPNPTTDVAYINFNDNSASHDIVITDAMGRVVMNLNNYNSNSFQVEKDIVGPGMYFISISNGSGSLSNHKLIID